MKIRLLRSPRLWMACGVLGGTLLAGALQAGAAHASYVICRTDPYVILSNGKQLDITDSVSDTASDISSIAYTLHIPAGVGVRKIVYTPGPLTKKETLTVFADSSANTYHVTSVVTTGTPGIPAKMTVTILRFVKVLAGGTASGVSGQQLSLRFTQI